MQYSLRKRRRNSKITKRKKNKITSRFKKSRKQYGGRSDPFLGDPFILEVIALLNNFGFTKSEKNDLITTLKRTHWRYQDFPNRKVLLIDKLNSTINATTSTPDEKKVFVNELINYWENPEEYIPGTRGLYTENYIE